MSAGSSILTLPKDKGPLGVALYRALQAGLVPMRAASCEWNITVQYLQGARRFYVADRSSGNIEVGYENDKGELIFRYEEALTTFSTQLGLLQKMDLAPQVKPKGYGLDAQRNRAVAQIVLDDMIGIHELGRFKLELWSALLQFGTAGILAWSEPRLSPDARPRFGLSVVPPWELTSIPAVPKAPGDIRAIQRTRWVPLEWAKAQPILTPPKDVEGQRSSLEIRDIPAGATPGNKASAIDGNLTQEAGGAWGGSSRHASNESHEGNYSSTKEGSRKDNDVTWVKLTETWVLGPSGTVARFIITSREFVLHDTDYLAEKRIAWMPMGIANYTLISGFYARNFMYPIIVLNQRNERMLRNLFKNIEDLDLMGMSCVPSTLGINKRQFRNAQRDKVLFFEPDYTVPSSQPFTLLPANAGALPGQVAQIGIGLAERVSSQTPMLRGQSVGRLDSAQAHGFVYEASTVPLSGPTASVRQAMGTAYRALLAKAKGECPEEGKPCGPGYTSQDILRLKTVDDALAGAVLDPRTGNMQLTTNVIPSPSEVEITIKDEMPRPRNQQIEELMSAFGAGILQLEDVQIEARLRDLDFPVGGKAVWNSYRKAMLHNLVLFNDGRTPGEVVGAPASDNPKVHLSVITAFMAGPEFELAEDPVREAFEERKSFYENMLGGYPEGLPYPEDLPTGQGPGPPMPGMMGQPGGPPAGSPV